MKATPKQLREHAAQLVAEGRLEYWQIAEKIGVDVSTLHRWRKEEKFAARVEEISEETSGRLLKLAIARKEYRVASLNRIQTKLETLIEDRAADMADVPGGGNTGLLVKQFKVSGETVVTEYAFDAAVVRELRAVKEQVAKELGQIVEKKELTGKDGGPLKHDVSVERLTDEQLNDEITKFAQLASSASDSEG